MKTFVHFAVAGFVLSAVVVVAAWAQEPDEGEEFQPRLPAYYGEVVDDTQKDEIYAIQKKYDEQLAPLRAQIADVLKKQQGEIEALLSAEQKAAIQKRIDQARKERAITRDLTPELRKAAQEAARKASLKAIKKAQEDAEKSGGEEPEVEKTSKDG